MYNELARICSLRYFRRTKNGRHTVAHNDPDASVVDRHRFQYFIVDSVFEMKIKIHLLGTLDADPDPDPQH